MEEIWKDVLNYEGLYQVSNFGRVKSFVPPYNRKPMVGGKILNCGVHRRNLVVHFCKDKVKTRFLVKHLVASHFIDGYSPSDNLICLDGNIRNNRIDNISLPKVADLDGEIWKTIEDFDGKFQISNLGRVKNDGVLATLSIGGKGYLRFGFSKNNKSKNYSVHRYVLTTFIGKPQGDRIYANHKSGVKTDNRLENLEWCTARENMLHSYQTGLHFGSKLYKKISQYTLDGELIKTYDSIGEAQITVNSNSVSACASGKQMTSRGFLWKFAE